MASNYTRYIEFKVKGQELTRAVDRIFKGVNKIELEVGKVNKKAKITGDVIKDVEKKIKKADTATQKWAKDLEKVSKAAQRSHTSIGKLLDAMRAFRPKGGPGGGIFRTVAEFGALEVVVRRLIPAVYQFASAHTGLITGVAAAGAAFKVGVPAIYSWGKAVRQAEQTTKDFIRIAGSSSLKKAVQSMFPAGSYLGGNRDLAAEKAAAAELKKKVEESKKLEKSTEKVAKQYKLVATGLNKSREQLSKLKKIQDQLLSSSKGYENVTKKILKVEREITKEERKRANINRRLDWKKDAMKLVGGRLGAIKLGAGALGGLAGGVFADDGIKRISAALGHQVGLFKVVTVSASKFFQGLKAVDQGARKGAATLDKYGRTVVNLVKEHSRLIQTTAGLAAGLDAVARFAPAAYNIGKGFRQLTFDIRKATEAIKKYGLEAGILSFAEKGSLAGKRFRNLMAGQPGALKHPSFEKELKEWGGASGTSGIRSQVEGLTKIGEVLNNNKKIQENINASVRGPYMQAAIAVKKLQFQYNLELAKTRLIQSAVTADIWIAKRGLADIVKLAQGIAGALKGLGGGILGGVLGGAKNLATGKAGPIGQAAVVIGISDAVKRLSQHIPFVSQAWKDNIQVFATWTKRVTEGLAAATIAHGAFSKAIAAAQWTTGAISGFMRWEKAAMLTFHRVNKGRIKLDRDMARWFDKGAAGQRRNNPIQNIWDKVVGGRRREIADIYNAKERHERPRDPAIVRMERALKTSQEMLKKTDVSAANYEQRQQRVLNLERAINAEMDKRRVILESMTPRELIGQSSFVGKQNVKNRMAMNRGHKFSGFGAWSADQEKLSAARKADAERERRLHQVLAINKKLEASGKRQLATWNLLSQKEQERRQSAYDLAAFKETYLKDRRRTARGRLANWQNIRAQKGQRLQEGLMLGAGFPMLFGGGAGAVGGGVLGAIGQSRMGAGKGFGMQILFSAIGQQIDAFVAKIGEVGKAFNAVEPNVTALIDAMGVQGTELGKQMKAYEQVASKEKSLAMATEQMALIIGDKGVAALKKYGEASTEWGNAFGQAMLRIQASVAGFLSWTGILNSEGGAQGRLNQTINRGDNAKINELQARIDKIRSHKGRLSQPKKNELARLRREQLRIQREEVDPKNAELLKNKTINESIRLKVQTMQEERTILENTLALGTREAGIQAEIARIVKEVKGDNESINEEQRKKIENEVRLKTALEEQVRLWGQIKDTLATGITDAVMGLIEGTKTLKESLAGILKQMARLIIQQQIAGLISGIPIPGLSGKRAKGGPVTGDKSYIVGERGPELFTPKHSGRITPNHQLGGTNNVVVNVDASGGTGVTGDDAKAAELGRLLSNAVQDELVKQKRPGGILTR